MPKKTPLDYSKAVSLFFDLEDEGASTRSDTDGWGAYRLGDFGDHRQGYPTKAAFVVGPDGPSLIWEDALYPFSPTGYTMPQRRPQGIITVLTPQPTLHAIRAGYVPKIVLTN